MLRVPDSPVAEGVSCMQTVGNRKGFTFVEAVIVISLLIVMAALAALPLISDVTLTKAGAVADKLKADLRYAQNLAMTRNQRTRVTFQTNGYAVTQGGVPVADPATGGSLSVTLNAGEYAGVTITAIGFSGNYVEFDTLGAPHDSAGPLATAKSITISGGRTVTVAAQTGRVN